LVFPEFDPVLINIGPLFGIGPLPIRWYALAYVAGLGLGWWYAARLIKAPAAWAPNRPPLNALQLDDLIMWVALGVIGGGRLGYALFYKPELYAQLFTGPDNLALLKLWDGGMSFHGGLIGVCLAIFLHSRSIKAPLLSVGDLVAPAVPIGLFFGRMANFINGELWGRTTDVPWGVRFCNQTIMDAYGFCPAGDVPRHPSQLYEAALEGLLLFAILWFAVWKWRLLSKPGYATGIFLLGYGLSRAILETVREPDAHMPEALQGTVTMGMLLSIPMILIGAWLIHRARSRPPVVAPAEA
jgi:phosphatidylglycerol---prolipoprotein diacylglyceryl transferase